MKVFWAESAEQDRVDIFEFIARDSPKAAEQMDRLFAAAAEGLEEHPRMGRPGQVPGTRELIPHESYRMVYEIQRDAVWVLALVHTARMWSPQQS